MKKKSISFVIIVMIIGLTCNHILQQLISQVEGYDMVVGTDTFYEDFDDLLYIPQDGWTFTHPNKYGIDNTHSIEGNSLATLPINIPGYDNYIFDGVQFTQTFTDSSIECWVKPLTTFLYPALWLRTTEIDPTDVYCSFEKGYVLFLTDYTAYLSRYDNHNWLHYATVDLGEIVSNKWWHMKLQAEGSILEAWVTQDEDFPTNPLFSIDTSQYGYQFTYGKPGISARTDTLSTYKTYFDNIMIMNSVSFVYESFEDPIPQDGWTYANEEYYSLSEDYAKLDDNSLLHEGNNGPFWDGVQHHEFFKDGSIEGWVRPMNTFLYPALWLRTTNLDPTDDSCTFEKGYVLFLTDFTVYLSRYDNGFLHYTSVNLGEIVSNKWWHMKLRAVGPILEAWVTQDEDLPITPLISVDTSQYGYELTYGRAGISARVPSSTNNKVYFDYFKIKRTKLCDDTTNPIVIITSPLDGSSIETINVQAYAFDSNGIDRVEFYLNELVEPIFTDNLYPYEWTTDITEYHEGEYTITAKAYDYAGNSDEYTITVNFDYLDAMIIVESELYNSYPLLDEAINLYKQNLIAQGFDTEVKYETFSSAQFLRSQLLAWYLTYNLDGVVLIGDYPYAQFHHDELIFGDKVFAPEDFICDLYLMDLDGTWIDSNSDGIYDQHNAGTGDIYPEIYVGRIDATTRTLGGLSNPQNIVNQLNKINSYHQGGISRTHQALKFVDDDWTGTHSIVDMMGAYDYTENVIDSDDTDAADWENILTENYEWAHLFAHSTEIKHTFAGKRPRTVSSSEIHNIRPTFNFYNLFCCNAADFSHYDCLAVTYLFSSDYSIAVIGTTKSGGMQMGSKYFYDSIGFGQTIGKGLLNFFKSYMDNYDPTGNIAWNYGLCILGDPFSTIYF